MWLRYGGEHKAKELQKEAVYGLTELYRDQVKSARLVANPGCYPTSVQLPLFPLLQVSLAGIQSTYICIMATTLLLQHIHDPWQILDANMANNSVPLPQLQLHRFLLTHRAVLCFLELWKSGEVSLG